MNRLVLAATLVERAALRYTPAGLPALDLGLKHESVVSEDGQPRKVSMEMRRWPSGRSRQVLMSLALGSGALFGGFLTSTRNGRGLLFHITSVEPSSAPSPTEDPSGLN
jgi:primosomal replication protein N